MTDDIGDQCRENFRGIMLINALHLSVNPPPIRGEEDYFERIQKKLTTALEKSVELNLLPIICGHMSQRHWDMDVFKFVFKTVSMFPHALIIGHGNMLTKTGDLRPKSILDLLSSTGESEIITPASRRNFTIFCFEKEYHFTLDSDGGFHVSVENDDGSKEILARSDDLPSLSRVTQTSSMKSSSVVLIQEGSIEHLVIDGRPPILSDARFDVSDIEDNFSSELVSRLSEMLAMPDEEAPQKTINEKLQTIFEALETSQDAREIVMKLQEHAGASLD
jgi:hypothetical protein